MYIYIYHVLHHAVFYSVDENSDFNSKRLNQLLLFSSLIDWNIS